MKFKLPMLIIALFLGLCMADNFSDNPDVNAKPSGHQCKFLNCPYKCITEHEFSSAVARYHQDGSDEYAIDMLHLLNPTWSYDEVVQAVNED